MLRRPIAPGSVIAGKYTVTQLLGEGGMGSVFEATQAFTNQRVAVKVLNAEWSSNDTAVQRFVQEARIVAELAHPNIAHVLDGGTDPRFGVFTVFERLFGQTLFERVEARGPLAVEEVVRWIVPVMNALAAAHDRAVIHRDFKSENVFLARQTDGSTVAKLLDFGISKVGSSAAIVRTKTGSILGTVSFMSPEQTRGDRALDHRADVWSAGVVLFECLTGRLPFEGTSVPEVVAAVLHDEPLGFEATCAKVSAALAAAVYRALEKRPEARFDGMRAFADEVFRACRVELEQLAFAETQAIARDTRRPRNE
jgi:serine/threonine protein kinase